MAFLLWFHVMTATRYADHCPVMLDRDYVMKTDSLSVSIRFTSDSSFDLSGGGHARGWMAWGKWERSGEGKIRILAVEQSTRSVPDPAYRISADGRIETIHNGYRRYFLLRKNEEFPLICMDKSQRIVIDNKYRFCLKW